jgi:hypothetical protein
MSLDTCNTAYLGMIEPFEASLKRLKERAWRLLIITPTVDLRPCMTLLKVCFRIRARDPASTQLRPAVSDRGDLYRWIRVQSRMDELSDATM